MVQGRFYCLKEENTKLNVQGSGEDPEGIREVEEM